MAAKSTGLFAFWRHSDYPFVCYGHITKFNDSGGIQTEEYGPGFWFKPFLILPTRAGEELAGCIKDVTLKRNAALKKFDKEWLDALPYGVRLNIEGK